MTIYRYIEAGKLKASKIGQWRIREKDIDIFLNKYRTNQKSMTNQTILNWVNKNKDKKSETEMKDELLKKGWKLEEINDALDIAFGRKAPSPPVSSIEPKRGGMGTVSLILGIIGLLLGPILGIIAIVCGVKGRDRKERFATAGLALGIIDTIAWVFLLIPIVLVALGNARVLARDARRKSDIQQIQMTSELYYVEKGEYPASLTVLDKYLVDMPKDPEGKIYNYTSSKEQYCVYAELEKDGYFNCTEKDCEENSSPCSIP